MINCPNKDKIGSHQEHLFLNSVVGTGFSCKEVLEMEEKFGRHIDNCRFVGYIAATKCCMKGNDGKS